MRILMKTNGIIIKVYNYLISRSFLNKRNRICRRIRAILYHNICFFCHAQFGRLNPERVFYVIRSPKSELGFFGLYNYVVDCLKEAQSLGAEPVVDWQYYPNDYLLEDYLVGRMNAWEYFFEPVSGISLKEVYRSQNVIMSDGRYDGTLSEVSSAEELLKSNKIIEKYIILNEQTKKVLNNEYNRLNMAEHQVLGVKCRGTDFKEARPQGHVICPDVDYTIKVITEKEKEWGKEFDRIFIATEDENMFQEMKKIYGERLLYNDTLRFETSNGKWLNQLFDQADDISDYKYKRMLEYLISVYLLASCDALISPVVGAALGAMRIKGQYEHFQLIHLGNYA